MTHRNLIIQFDAETGMEFFKRCEERKIPPEDIESRQQLFLELAREGYSVSIMSTNRTHEEVIEHYSKRHKIVHIKKEEE